MSIPVLSTIVATSLIAGCSQSPTSFQASSSPQAEITQNAVASAVEVPFGTHGIATTLPQREYAEVRLTHYHGDPKNLDLSIYTQTLSRRADYGEGLLLRYSPTLETYSSHISETIDNLRPGTDYAAWSFADRDKTNSATHLDSG